MKDVGQLLREADPLIDEPGLSPVEAQIMRRAMLAAVDERPALYMLWPRPLAIAATIALTLAAGVVVGRRLPPRDASDIPATRAEPREAGERRQLQFATPGGTRIIWVFNQDFEP